MPGGRLQVKSIATAQLMQGKGRWLAQVTREGQSQQWAADDSATVALVNYGDKVRLHQ